MTCPFCRSKKLAYHKNLQWECLDCKISFDERAATTSAELWHKGTKGIGMTRRRTAYDSPLNAQRAFPRPDWSGRLKHIRAKETEDGHD